MTAAAPGSRSRVATIVLNYRHVADTLRCVRSLQKSDFRDQHILVVDNAADGPTTEELRDQLSPDVEVIASGSNLGYAGGNNVGIRRALDQGSEFVWIVNPDTEAEPDTLSGLVQAAEANPDAGAVGCRMLVGGSQPARIESIGGSIDGSRGGATPKRLVGRFDREVLSARVQDVDWVSGGCVLLRRAAIDDVGLLPEEYFLYYEDTEYCLRLQRAGWRTIVAQGTRMWHFRRSSSDLPSASYVYYLYRNRIHFALRNFDSSVDDVVEQCEGLVHHWRTQVSRHAPGMLGTLDDLIRLAKQDARDGRYGRVEAVEEIHIVPDIESDRDPVDRLTASLEQERQRAQKDVERLLTKIESGSAKVRDLESQLQGLRASRTYRLATLLRAATKPLRALRALLARGDLRRRRASR